MKLTIKIYGITFFTAATVALASISSCSSDEPLEPDSPTFSANIENVFSSNCASCHESGANYAPMFSGYDEVKDRAMNGALLDRIQSDSNPMPPSGKMSSEDIQLFLDWADGGYPK